MPIYETREESGRLSLRLKAHQLVEQDIQDYGAIERSDQELEVRAQYHVVQMQARLPTPQAVLTDDGEALTRMIEQYYSTIYKGLLIAYTGLKEPSRLTVDPRYSTTVNLDDTEDEHPFIGLAGLQAIIKGVQDQRRKAAQDDECDPSTYLLTMIQVTIYDAKEADLKWSERPNHFFCYTLDGDNIDGIIYQTDVSDDVLYGLGLPIVETISSTKNIPILYTIGYRQPLIEAVLTQLISQGYPILDIRERAGSRFNPLYNRARLEERFPGLYYRIPELGNVNHNQPDAAIVFKDLQAGLEKSEQIIRRTGGAIYLCACQEWKMCHRSKAANHLLEKLPELTIVHIETLEDIKFVEAAVSTNREEKEPARGVLVPCYCCGKEFEFLPELQVGPEMYWCGCAEVITALEENEVS